MKKLLCGLFVFFFSSTTSLWAWDVDLGMYHDKSLAQCENNIPCTRLARWQCIAQACGEGGSQKPTDCYLQLAADKAMADVAICQADSWPSSVNLQSVVEALPGAKIEDVLQGIMMIRAIRGDGAGCQARIKEYVGPYGPSWSAFWVSAASGCRILSQERSWQEEDSDYQVWKDVGLGKKQCSDIAGGEMREMCNSGVLSYDEQP